MSDRKHKHGKTPPAAHEPADDPSPEAHAIGESPARADDVEALRAERDDLLARLQRVTADYLNYKKRVQRDIEQAREYANEELIRSLLGVLDSMERALEAARANHGEDSTLFQGMQLVHNQALETLAKFGVTVIEAEGRPFDPDLHAAMLQQPSERHPPMTVLQEVQKGYRYKGRTIRPSTVVVSTAPDAQAAGGGTGEE